MQIPAIKIILQINNKLRKFVVFYLCITNVT